MKTVVHEVVFYCDMSCVFYAEQELIFVFLSFVFLPYHNDVICDIIYVLINNEGSETEFYASKNSMKLFKLISPEEKGSL